MIIFTDNILVTMELLAESLRGWGSAYYNVFSPKGIQLYGGNLPQGNSDEHQFCLPKNACSTILMQSQGKNTEIGRLIDAYIPTRVYILTYIFTYIDVYISFHLFLYSSFSRNSFFHFIPYFYFSNKWNLTISRRFSICSYFFFLFF